jgi:hypothetical protein
MGEIATALGIAKGAGGRLSAAPASAVARQIANGGRRPRRRRSMRDRRIHQAPPVEPRVSDTSASAGDDAIVRGEEIVLERGQRVAVRIRIELENLGLSVDALAEEAEGAPHVESQECADDSSPGEELQERPTPEPAPDPVPDTGEDSLRECVEAHVKLLSELAAPIVDAEGSDHLRARLAEFTGFISPRHPRLLRSLVFRRGGVVDPEDLIRRALRVPGDQEREVQLALGELVSYLEFELLNHPGIEEGASILEGLRGLRSRL